MKTELEELKSPGKNDSRVTKEYIIKGNVRFLFVYEIF